MRPKKAMREVLAYLVQAGGVMIDGFFPRQYPEARLARKLLGLDTPHASSRAAAKHSLSSILSHLKKQGLVARAGPHHQSMWSITAKGRTLLKQRGPGYDKLDCDLPPEDGIARLVAFDIPEKERRKRDWIRAELLTCGFRAIQKSVYLGRRPLPEEVIARIAALNLTRRVHIIGIEKSGTLSRQI